MRRKQRKVRGMAWALKRRGGQFSSDFSGAHRLWSSLSGKGKRRSQGRVKVSL